MTAISTIAKNEPKHLDVSSYIDGLKIESLLDVNNITPALNKSIYNMVKRNIASYKALRTKLSSGKFKKFINDNLAITTIEFLNIMLVSTNIGSSFKEIINENKITEYKKYIKDYKNDCISINNKITSDLLKKMGFKSNDDKVKKFPFRKKLSTHFYYRLSALSIHFFENLDEKLKI